MSLTDELDEASLQIAHSKLRLLAESRRGTLARPWSGTLAQGMMTEFSVEEVHFVYTAEQAGNEIRILWDEIVGIRIPTSMFRTLSGAWEQGIDDGPAMDRLLLSMSRHLADPRTTGFVARKSGLLPSLGRTIAMPRGDDTADANGWCEAIAAALAATIPTADWKVELRSPLGSIPLCVEITDSSEQGVEYRPTDRLLEVLARTIVPGHGYELKDARTPQGEAKRRQVGLPIAGLVAITQGTSVSVINRTCGPIDRMRRIAAATDLLSRHGLSVEHVAEPVEPIAPPDDQIQRTVRWDSPRSFETNLNDILDPLFGKGASRHIGYMLTQAVEDSEDAIARFFYDHNYRGAAWYSVGSPSINAASRLTRWEAGILCQGGILKKEPVKGELVSDKSLERACLASETLDNHYGMGPVLPGARLPGASSSIAQTGWILGSSDGLRFEPRIMLSETPAQARVRLGISRRIPMFEALSVAGGVWLDTRRTSDRHQDLAKTRLPPEWHVKTTASWELKERTRMMIGCLDAHMRLDPNFDATAYTIGA